MTPQQVTIELPEPIFRQLNNFVVALAHLLEFVASTASSRV
jgi:hypothetical protein